ncbi:MAG: RnfABCDGE type electron transport complex subunit G [Leptospirales bacterium]
MAAQKKDVLILVLIATFSGLLLSGTYILTKKDIAKAKIEKQKKALKAVMPFLGNNPYEKIVYKYQENTINIFTVTENENFLGAALELKTKKGYSGWIVFYLGVDADGKVTGMYITESKETPGLGDKAKDKKWWGQFVGKSKEDFIFKVEKDKGDVVSITASTITSRAITNASDQGLDLYKDFLANGAKTNVVEAQDGKK